MARKPIPLVLQLRVFATLLFIVGVNTLFLGWLHHDESHEGAVEQELQKFSKRRVDPEINKLNTNNIRRRNSKRQLEEEKSTTNSNNTSKIISKNNNAAIHKPHTTTSQTSFSACLLVNDENPRLPEWLAYHYHTLPLRSLIVAIDPNSRSSPKQILERWNSMGMEIEIWDQDVYLPEDMLASHGKCDSSVQKGCKWKHRHRQSYFVMKCLSEFKKRKKSWVLLTDVDEYITFNYRMEDDPVDERIFPMNVKAEDASAARDRLPSFGRDVTILDVLQKERNENYGKQALRACVSVPRLLYGSRESDGDSSWDAMAPEGFRDQDFMTLRYRWHAPKGEKGGKVWGKTMIDVSRVPADALTGAAKSIHRPLERHCMADPSSYNASLLRVNHYLDSFEAFSYRNDARSSMRKSREYYDKKGTGADVGYDDTVRPWLKNFVETVGLEKSKELLANAGSFVSLS